MIPLKLLMTAILAFTLTAQAFGEDIEGTIQQVIVEDPTAAQEHFFLIRKGQPELLLEKLDPVSKKFLKSLAPRSKVKLSGKKVRQSFQVIQASLVKGAKKTLSGARVGGDYASPLESGVRTVAIIPLHFGDPSKVACDPEMVKGFLSPNGLTTNQFNQNLGGKVTFSPTLLEAIQVTDENCFSAFWRYEASVYFQKKGINIYDFNIIMLLVPKGATCGASWGWLGDGSNMKEMGVMMHPVHCSDAGAIGHEIGHTIGWDHASTPTAEYGDFSDIMGGALLVHSSGPRKIASGMLKSNQIQTITGPGLYRLVNLIDNSAGIKALRWPLRNTVTLRGQTFTDLYVSFRPWSGMDAIAVNKDRFDKTHMHLWQGASAGYTQLIGSLGDNEAADVTQQPVSVKQISHDSQGSLVCIKIDGVGDCSVEISPPRNINTFTVTTSPKMKLNATITDESIPYVGSVSFKLNSGAPIVDNSAPYSVCGDTGTDPCDALAAGNHKVTITAHAGANGAGAVGPSVVKDFTKTGGPLPVTLTSFTGTSGNGGITLVWKTTGESKFDRFEVESSTDAKNWKKVATVKGTQAASYSSVVPATFLTSYFRLKMIDTDSTFSYSRIISVKSSVVPKAILPKPVPGNPRIILSPRK